MAAAHFNALPQEGRIIAEYVWIGGAHTTGGVDMRSKGRVLDSVPDTVADLPDWNYDGSSTAQAPGTDSEVIIKPRAIFKCPFRLGQNILVMCDTYTPQGEPLPTNNRAPAVKIFEQYGAKTSKPWFGIEQEYTLFEEDNVTPLGWPKNGFPGPQGPYYCSAGSDCSFGRDIADAHVKACLFAGIKLSGINAEVMPGQWEYQVGPCVAIESGDHLAMSRYLMIRVCEMFGKIVTFEPKPKAGDWNGAGCHTNISTEEMRQEGGYAKIIEAIEKMGKKHEEHIAVYGKDNDKRLTGAHETAPIDKFSYGVANRGASVRIPRAAEAEGKGYFEDRRPGSNICGYEVTAKIFETISA